MVRWIETNRLVIILLCALWTFAAMSLVITARMAFGVVGAYSVVGIGCLPIVVTELWYLRRSVFEGGALFTLNCGALSLGTTHAYFRMYLVKPTQASLESFSTWGLFGSIAFGLGMWLLSKHSGFAQSESPIMETNDDKVLSYIKGLSLQADAPDLSWDANREDWVFKGTALTVREAIQHLAASGELESLANLHGISRDRLAECVAWLYNAHLVHCRNLSENLKNLSRDIELLTHKSSRSSLWGSSYLLREY